MVIKEIRHHVRTEVMEYYKTMNYINFYFVIIRVVIKRRVTKNYPNKISLTRPYTDNVDNFYSVNFL